MTRPKDGSIRHKRPPVAGGRPHRVRVQLTDTELEDLQALSDQLDIGIPEILVDSAFDDSRKTTRVMASELDGIRRVVTDEVAQLRRIADILDRDKTVELAGWDEMRRALHERNLRLAKHLGW